MGFGVCSDDPARLRAGIWSIAETEKATCWLKFWSRLSLVLLEQAGRVGGKIGQDAVCTSAFKPE